MAAAAAAAARNWCGAQLAPPCVCARKSACARACSMAVDNKPERRGACELKTAGPSHRVGPKTPSSGRIARAKTKIECCLARILAALHQASAYHLRSERASFFHRNLGACRRAARQEPWRAARPKGWRRLYAHRRWTRRHATSALDSPAAPFGHLIVGRWRRRRCGKRRSGLGPLELGSVSREFALRIGHHRQVNLEQKPGAKNEKQKAITM